ncbi:PqqD family protein [Hathewaya histolytica]|uniref:SynChlorMet cassette protein ScmD n=1 Tax=Hathewaya histolytica TaxID=1498 RepID=A0A4U9RTX1_HATHI|nr:PqqD family protein [Hathewaya histolytica]VTQ95852.1 SynChlorMet cassette protein ScmD [Hathewaya histolytica]
MKKEEDKNFLFYIPIKKYNNYEIKNNKVFLVFHHDKILEKIMRWLVKKPYKSDIELDTIGSFIWINIDGESTVYDLGEKLKNEFGDKCNPIYDRLILYLRYLYKRGWIGLKEMEEK